MLFAKKYWTTPPADILPDSAGSIRPSAEYAPEQIASVLSACGIACKPHSATVGASVVQYHLLLADLRQGAKAMRSATMVSMALHRSVTVIMSPVAHLCVSVARLQRDTVPLKRVMLTNTFNGIKSPTACVLGADTTGRTIALDVADMPHLLIAGATGSGKSVLMHSIIASMLFKATPASLRLLMIDPKQIELTAYDGLPHLMRPVITDVPDAISALEEICTVMDNRYRDMRRGKTGHPRLVVVIDELADLILTSKAAVQDYIVRLAQKGRACGIHLIIATQQPRAAVLTGLIRANIPCKITLQCATAIDSRIALGRNGAEQLSGKGDALLCLPSDAANLVRFQAAYTSPEDISAIVRYWTSKACKKRL